MFQFKAVTVNLKCGKIKKIEQSSLSNILKEASNTPTDEGDDEVFFIFITII